MRTGAQDIGCEPHRVDRYAAPANGEPQRTASWRSFAIVAALATACALPTTASAGELFAGIWAENCSSLSGSTFIFHDGDRVRIVDLDCRIVAWKRVSDRYASDLACTLDGVPRQTHIEVTTMGERLHIAMGGLSQVVEPCP
ncbi:hypothetical protein [Shinella sp.]|uniref:hypothetical protein n=1 Tax=Shinella sp. TaxID=1870904 RepID=UPI0039E2D2A6